MLPVTEGMFSQFELLQKMQQLNMKPIHLAHKSARCCTQQYDRLHLELLHFLQQLDFAIVQNFIVTF